MIPDFFISSAYWFLSTIISWFGTSTGFSPDAFSAISWMGAKTTIFSPIIPFNTLAITFGIVTLIEGGIFGFKTFKWLLSYIPIMGGKGV